MNLSLVMSSMQGMRKASVLPLPVFAAARTSLQRQNVCRSNNASLPQRVTSTDGTHLPSSRGRMLLCWISVMCLKPISCTAFSVLSLTSEAREANDVSSNAPGIPRMERLATVSYSPGQALRVLEVGLKGRRSEGFPRQTATSFVVCLC